MKISLITPTIDSAERSFLQESLASAQAISPELVDEILIIDNSKSSSFKEHLQELTGEDHRFQIHSFSEDLSMAGCWNKGLNLVKNPWHLYLHDDDRLNHHVFNQLTREEFPDVGFISFDFHKLVDDKLTTVTRKPELEGIIENTPKFIATIYSTDKLRALGGWDPQAGYFLDLLALIKLHIQYQSLHINNSLGDYRIHLHNASSIEKRSRGYGDRLPYVLSELYPLITSELMKKKLLYHMLTFSYPNNNLSSRVAARLLRDIGKDVWIGN